MIPIVLLVLGLGALAAYELSPDTHAWVDEHIQAIRDSHDAHAEAQEHLGVATLVATAPSPGAPVAPPPPSATVPAPPDASALSWRDRVRVVRDKLAAAQAATQVAAQKTAIAAKAASTPKEKAVAAATADRTLAMQTLIQSMYDLLGASQDFQRDYARRRIEDAQARIKRADAELLHLGAPSLAAGAEVVASLLKGLGVGT